MSAFFVSKCWQVSDKVPLMFSKIVGLSMMFSPLAVCIDITVKRLLVTYWIEQCNRMQLLHFNESFIVINST
ncbi:MULTISPECIES: hypothetical protein [Vibrio]|uniref:hypothetical protein n=1 Tax=Vibrio TaxID=662 RepID=UPI00142EAEF3|nr:MULTISPECIES: hypothetical protein [Vibrio]